MSLNPKYFNEFLQLVRSNRINFKGIKRTLPEYFSSVGFEYNNRLTVFLADDEQMLEFKKFILSCEDMDGNLIYSEGESDREVNCGDQAAFLFIETTANAENEFAKVNLSMCANPINPIVSYIANMHPELRKEVTK